MSTYRCPKHDKTFEAEKPPTQDGHSKCPDCNPKKKDAEEKQ